MQKFFEAGAEYTANLIDQLGAIEIATSVSYAVLVAIFFVACLAMLMRQKFQQSRALAASTDEPSEFDASPDPHMQEELRRCLNGTLDTDVGDNSISGAKVIAFNSARALNGEVAYALTGTEKNFGRAWRKT